MTSMCLMMMIGQGMFQDPTNYNTTAVLVSVGKFKHNTSSTARFKPRCWWTFGLVEVVLN